MKEKIIKEIEDDVTSLSYIFRKEDIENDKEMLNHAIWLSGQIHNKLLGLRPKG